ncbi:MAG: restriction endonuclease subunit S [Polyangiaceae bacterium]
MFGDPVSNPKGWPEKALGDLADLASGVTKGKRYEEVKTISLPYMRVANVQDGHLVLDDVASITVSEHDAQRYLLRAGDVLLTEGGDPDKLGRGAVWRGEVDPCIHQNHIFRVRPNGAVLSEYLSALIGSQRGKRYFLRASKQTTGIATINMTQLKAFPTLVPPRDVQENYVALLARCRVAQEHQQIAARRVQGLFDSLVQGAFSERAQRRFGQEELAVFDEGASDVRP